MEASVLVFQLVQLERGQVRHEDLKSDFCRRRNRAFVVHETEWKIGGLSNTQSSPGINNHIAVEVAELTFFPNLDFN